MELFSGQYWLARLLFERSLAALYLLAFIVAYNQFPALLGERGLIILHQRWLIISGNYSWLNWLTVVLALLAIPDAMLAPILAIEVPAVTPRPLWYEVILVGLLLATLILSWNPIKNFFSRRQLMNYSYNPFRLVNAYGAFGSVTKQRYEIVLEGTQNADPTEQTGWLEYGFKAKPDDPGRMPPQIAPYHLRLDWMMWFLPLRTAVVQNEVRVLDYEPWFIALVGKLLKADKPTLKLLRHDPFPDTPPRLVPPGSIFMNLLLTANAKRPTTGGNARTSVNIWRRFLSAI